jgi:hypothetical protein
MHAQDDKPVTQTTIPMAKLGIECWMTNPPKHAGWMPMRVNDGAWNVIPLGDLRDHETVRPCWCRPFETDGIIVHNSMDGREFYERGRKMS